MNKVKVTVRKATKKEEFLASKGFDASKAKPEVRTGFIVGDTGIWDKIKTIRDAASRYAEKYGIQAAIEAQLINGDNQVLDNRKQMFGKPNKQLGYPLKPNQVERTRTLYVVMKASGASEYKFGSLQTNDSQLSLGWNKIKFFTPCQVYMTIKEETKDEFKANTSVAEDTKSIFKAVNEKLNVEEIFDKVVGTKLTKMPNLEREYELIKDAWDRKVFVKGIVSRINFDRATPWGSVKMGLMSEDGEYEVTVDLPEQVPKVFGEGSEVIVMGKPDRSDARETDEDNQTKWIKGAGPVMINAFGVYTICATPVGSGQTEVLEEETAIAGWLD